MNYDLLPCPFCGEIPRLSLVGNFTYVSCRSGSCLNPMTGSWPQPDQAVQCWNTRAQVPQWLPISDHDKSTKPVLGFFSSGHIEGIQYVNEDGGYWLFLSDGDSIPKGRNHPTHYMPLPDPPKTEQPTEKTEE